MASHSNFQSGIALSKKVQNSLIDIVGDIHDEIGSFKCQKLLAKESGSTITAKCFSAVVPNGDTYYFSKTSASIFKRTQSGTWSSVRSNGAADASTGHTSCLYYNGKLYYTTLTKLGRFDLASTWTDSYQTLTSGNHPMEQFDLILYIANGKDIAQVDDADVFSSSGLDLPVQFQSMALKSYGDDLLIGSKAGDYITDSKIWRWNTYSPSWSLSDPIKEVGIHTFIDADNYLFILAGTVGNIYLFGGSQMDIWKQIPNFDSTTVNHQMSANYKGRALIANGSRIYSIHRKSRDLDFALVCEYECSQGSTAKIESIVVSGDDLLVAWSLDATYGVDNVTTDYATAVLETTMFNREDTIQVPYDELPSGTSIAIAVKQDGETSYTDLTVEVDSEDRRVVKLKDDMVIKRNAQARITLTPNGTSTPVIDSVDIYSIKPR